MRFSHAIVRLPGGNFADGLTTSPLGAPSFERAYRQHAAYIEALETCGLAVTVLEPDIEHPDAHFVEDTAVLTGTHAILTRPGAPERAREVDAIREAVGRFFNAVDEIVEPGTVDGGDVCEAGDHFYIGLSHRTNAQGAAQLAQLLSRAGKTSTILDIRDVSSILHLKSGMAYLEDGRFVVVDALADRLGLPNESIVRAGDDETYGSNCVAVNDRVLLAAGHPNLERDLVRAGYSPLVLEMSEFQKMDGGLSCLSLRF